MACDGLVGEEDPARPAGHRIEYHDPISRFQGQFAGKSGGRESGLSLRLAAPSRAQTLKKQAIARGALAETAMVTSNMGYHPAGSTSSSHR
jgi:hypothetical protein